MCLAPLLDSHTQLQTGSVNTIRTNSVAEQPAPVHDMAQFSPGLYISIESNYIETVTETEE